MAPAKVPHDDDWLRSGRAGHGASLRRSRGPARIVFAAALSMVTSAARVSIAAASSRNYPCIIRVAAARLRRAVRSFGPHRHVNA